MAKIQKKSLDSPDDKRKFDKGEFNVVAMSGMSIGRGTFQPGWRWSKSVKPIVKTKSCENNHIGYIISGRMKIRLDDGSEGEIGPGDAVHIPPGHDAWVLGDEAVVMLEFQSASGYAKPSK